MDSTERIPADIVRALRGRPVASWDARDEAEPAFELSLGKARLDGSLRRMGLVAAGGQGEIHLARDEALRRHVALKVLSAGSTASARQQQRFATEAQLTAQLEHPNIVPVYARTTDADGEPGYAMKLVQGRTLGDVIDALGPVPRRDDLPRLLEVLLKVCDAVAYAHARGVVHRDLKPDNIMVGEHGEVYVMDWGLASVRDQTSALDITTQDEPTLPGTALGTPTYMAPEQAGGAENVTGAADQYALGLILYEILCRRPPRSSEGSVMDRMVRASHGARRPIRAEKGGRRAQPPRELVAVVEKATQLHPARRYASVSALADDLRCFLDDRPVAAAPDGLVHGAMRWLSRHRGLTLAGLVVATLLGITAASALAVAGSSGLAVYQWTAEAQQARWRSLTARVAHRADDLDHAMARIVGQLEAIDAAAAALLVHADAPAEQVFTPTDFAAAAHRPADTDWSDLYDRPLSTRWPASLVAPTGQRTQAAVDLQRLAPLRHVMRRAHIVLRQELEELTEAEAEAAWRTRDGPIRWTLVGTEAGAYLDLPGAAWDPAGYDPRQRPWYTTGRTTDGASWGLPYPEASTGGLLLPCVAGIRADDGRLLGVAAIDVAFSYLVDRYLGVDHEAVTEVLLVSEDGRVMVRSSALGEGGRPTQLGDAYATPPYPHAEAVQASRDGIVDLPDGRTRLILRRLRTTGWWYVVEVDRRRVGG